MIEHVCPATDLALAWDPKRRTVLDHVRAHDAKGGVNWGYFSTSDGAPAGRVVLDGREVWGATGREWPMVALRNGLLVVLTESVPAHDCTWAAAAGPIIVLNRQISRSGWNAFASARLDSPAERIVIGARKGGTEAVIRIYTHQTAETVAREMIAAGCDWAVLGDGGGSATWVRDGRQLHPIGTARRVPTAILWGATRGAAIPDAQEPGGLPITIDLLPAGHPLRPGTKITPRYITVHSTANASTGADALAHALYLRSGAGGRKVSWHFTVDDRRIVQHLPIDEMGWHAGTSAGNSQSIGIEICENADGDAEKAVDLAARLVAHLCRILGLRLDAVVPHQHWSGKHCPRLILERPGGWQAFVNRVAGYLGGESVDVPDGVMGQKGPAVVAVQRLLNRRHGASLAEDGIWGPKTDAAYRAALHG